ncbi:hypothetical protein AMJ49_04315 [Parcubacteria bacterium DG_74_2]|nr:MAG: hypothetical protein AMJ49_04315 [Parcubacteria bacterium DG_74_2]
MVVKFDLNLHKRFLVNLLIEICKALGDKVAFKGGTSALLFYNLNRFSFDLDFDILKPFTKEDIDKIKEILSKNGNIKDYYNKRFTVFFLFDYQKNYPNIKLEFNKRLLKNSSYKTVWFMGVKIKIADETTSLTNKLIALANRRQSVSRDLFDLYYFLNLGFPINEKLIKEKTGKSKKQYLNYLIKFIKKIYTSRNVLQGLGESLEREQKEWVKEKLILDTIKQLKKRISGK